MCITKFSVALTIQHFLFWRLAARYQSFVRTSSTPPPYGSMNIVAFSSTRCILWPIAIMLSLFLAVVQFSTCALAFQSPSATRIRRRSSIEKNEFVRLSTTSAGEVDSGKYLDEKQVCI